MGSMLISQCQCGYESDILSIGGGMISMNKEYYLPYYCDDCEIVVERNILKNSGSKLKKYNKCPKCFKKVKYYGSITENNVEDDFLLSGPSCDIDINFRFNLDDRYNLDDNNNHCPKCKKDNLTFNLVGCWD